MNTDTNTELVMTHDGIHFTLTRELVAWVYGETPKAYSYYELISLVGVVRSAFNGGVGSAKLYGDSVKREVRAELFDKTGAPFQTQCWLLRFDLPYRLRLL